MQNVVGSIAEKENFYPRKREIDRIKRALDAGDNLQLSAPRRVGKSSILVEFENHPPDGYFFVYIDVESVRDVQNYYRKIYKKILSSSLASRGTKIWEQLKSGTDQLLQRLKNIHIPGVGGFEINESVEVDYEEELLHFLEGIDLEKRKLVILVDEFPEVILNILEDDKGDTQRARQFLQSNRSLRNNDTIRKRVQFVYTGSSSLNVTAESLQSTELINDIRSIPIRPLIESEAQDLVLKVLTSYGFIIGNEELEYLSHRVEWLIPFYFQLIIQEIMDLTEPGEAVTLTTIDQSIEAVARPSNNHHFEHYVNRLKRIFPDSRYTFVMLLLKTLCQREQMTRAEIFNLAHGLINEDQIRRTLEALRDDGYILVLDTNNTVYKFNSSIFKKWWYNHEC